jgi:peptide/nickel transport system permease protein
VIRAKDSEYMLAARASDFSTGRMLVRHLLPNVIVQPLLYASSDCTYALLVTASVSFLGAGVQVPQAEWGQMVAQGTQFFPSQWWLSAFPAIAIVFSAVAFALIADGLTELFRRGVGGT